MRLISLIFPLEYFGNPPFSVVMNLTFLKIPKWSHDSAVGMGHSARCDVILFILISISSTRPKLRPFLEPTPLMGTKGMVPYQRLQWPPLVQSPVLLTFTLFSCCCFLVIYSWTTWRSPFSDKRRERLTLLAKIVRVFAYIIWEWKKDTEVAVRHGGHWTLGK